jgi:hypothetical protein
VRAPLNPTVITRCVSFIAQPGVYAIEAIATLGGGQAVKQTARECRNRRVDQTWPAYRLGAVRSSVGRSLAHKDEGYAAVDALVALVIISLAVTLSLIGLRHAREVADRGAEVRQAHALLAFLLAEPETSSFPMEGENVRFTWTVKREPTDATRPVAICRRTATLHSKISSHDYDVVTLEPCVPEESL